MLWDRYDVSRWCVGRSLSDYSILRLHLLASDFACSLHYSHLISRHSAPFISLLIVFCLSHVHPGLASGAVWGLREGARRPLAVSNSRLRINSILNSVTRRGTFIGNSAGVMGVCVLLSLSSLTNSLG